MSGWTFSVKTTLVFSAGTEEFVMQRFIMSVAPAIKQSGARRSPSQKPRRAALRIERLEERLAPALLPILQTEYHNPPYTGTDPDRFSDVTGGGTVGLGFPVWNWTPILDRHDPYGGGVVGISGTVVRAEVSDNDFELVHPWGHDHEYYIARDVFDDGRDPFRPLVASSNFGSTGDYGEANQEAELMGLARGVLGVETDQGLIPPAYRPSAGDRVAVFGRWIVDTGHDDFHTEIHPPLLTVKAHRLASAPTEWTTSTVLGNPYLVSQQFTVGDDRPSPFLNGGHDDGAVGRHLLHEVEKTLGIGCPWYYFFTPCSLRIEAHSGILKPFQGVQTMDYIVRPPTPRADPRDLLVESYHLTVRSGVSVDFHSVGDEVHVRVTMNASEYTPLPLPRRHEHTFNHWGQWLVFLTALVHPYGLYAGAIAARGVLYDTYDPPRESDISDTRDRAIVVDNTQAFPISGYINVGWQRFAPVHFAVDAPAETVAGSTFPITVRALDPSNNPVPDYRGTVHFTGSDLLANLPGDYTFGDGDQGSHQWSVTLRTAGAQTIMVRDTVDAPFRGSVIVGVVPGPANNFVLSDVLPSLAAGQPSYVTVTARDSFGNTAIGYRGTVHFTSSDAAASLPSDYTFTRDDGGRHSWDHGITLRTTGSQLIAVTDTVDGTIIAPPSSITVTPEVASTFQIVFSTSFPIAGARNPITVTAKDRFGNTAIGYRGTVHFTISDDGAASVPDDYRFTGDDRGSQTWVNGITLRTAGSQTVTVTDTVNPQLTASFQVLVFPGQANYFLLFDIPPVLRAGVPSDLTVVAIDGYANIARGYRGTVHFTSSDQSMQLPQDYTFRDYDDGYHTWRHGLTAFTAGQPTLVAVDRVTDSIDGRVSLTVAPAAASRLVVEAPAHVPAGAPFDVTVSALDPYDNRAAGYDGTVTFTSSDDAALLLDGYTFTPTDGGAHTFAGVTLFTPGDQTLWITDPDRSLSSSATITVDSGGGGGAGGAAPSLRRPGALPGTRLAQPGDDTSRTLVGLWPAAGLPPPVSSTAAARAAPPGPVLRPLDVTPVDQFFATDRQKVQRAVLYRPRSDAENDDWWDLAYPWVKSMN
jgi:hypothetical protein